MSNPAQSSVPQSLSGVTFGADGGAHASTSISSTPSTPAQTPPTQGSSPSAPVATPSSTLAADPSAPASLSGVQFDSTPQVEQGSSEQEQPGLISRAAETSGIPQTLQLAGAQIEHTVQAPIDAYHEAIDAANQGDWKAATKAASKIVNAPSSYGIDKDSPIYKALSELIMQPINQIAESFKEQRKAGASKVEAGIATAAHTLNATPNDEELGQIGQRLTADKGDISSQIGDIAGGLGTSHGASSIPVVGPMVNQVGGNLDEDLHAHNYSAAVGDVLGPLLTVGIGKLLGRATSTTGVKPPPTPPGGLLADVAPTTKTIAGIKVPQASESVNAGRLSALASEKAATDFVTQKVQPAARAALQSNFSRSALSDVDSLRAAQGLDNTAINPPKQPLFDLDKIGKFMKDEAQVTYKKLDNAAASDIAEWKQQEKLAKEADAKATEEQQAAFKLNPNSEAATAPKPVTTAQDALPPEPKLFTDLQTQLKRAKRVIESKNPNLMPDVRAAAFKDLPKLQAEMDNFIAKHEEDVNPGELDAANRIRAKATRYGYLANKIRTATEGVGAGIDAGETGKDVKVPETTLDSIPAQFDNKYGAGAFNKLVGPEGRANYNSVIKALQTPETGGRLLQFLQKIPWHLGETTTSLPASAIIDNLLFNADFGKTAMSAFDRFKQGRATAAQAAKSAGRATVAAAPVGVASQPSKSNNGADAARQALGNPKKGKRLDAPIEGTPTGTTPDTGATASPDAATLGNRAIEDLPPEIRNAVSTIPVNVVNGAPHSDSKAPQGAVAGVDQGAGNNTIEINSPQDFKNNPTATMGHELTHVWQNNLPPSIQAKIPADKNDASAFDISDVDKLRKQGKTLVDLPREKSATIVQKYIEAKPGSDTRKKLQPWVDDLGNTPLSSTQPTSPDATKLNMNPRAPGLPSGVAGLNGTGK